MNTTFKLDASVEEGVKKLLLFLLEKKKIGGAVVLQKMDGHGAVSYSLITDAGALADASPLLPLMPVNAASVLSRLTLKEPFSGPIAAVIRPCELRAFIELIKRGQGNREQFILISSVCGGVYPLQAALTNGGIEEKLPDYWKALGEAEIVPDLRPTCRACEQFIPMGADMTVATMGREDLGETCTIFLQTDRAVELIRDAAGEMSAGELSEGKAGKKRAPEERLESDLIRRHRGARKDQKKKLSREMKLDAYGLDGMIEMFGKCIGCHGCRAVCPICYCELCVFESQDFEPKPVDFERALNRKEALRIPPDTVLYHLGRLNHMAISCVGCGSCSDVCPVDIPVSSIFLQVGESVQELFDYLPGRDPEEEVPITKYENEELAEFED